MFEKIQNFFTNKKTNIAAGTMTAVSLAYASGYIDLQTFLALQTISGAGGLAALRAAVARIKEEALRVAVEEAAKFKGGGL
jgi:hypothetical protein